VGVGALNEASEIDLDFDLDGLTGEGFGGESELMGGSSLLGPEGESVLDSGSDSLLGPEGDSVLSAEEGSSLLGGGGSFLREDSEDIDSFMESPGFDGGEVSGEVSQLDDVDLTLIGSYHATGRHLHHATDVVWSGRKGAVTTAVQEGKAPPPVAQPPQAPPPPPVQAPPPPRQPPPPPKSASLADMDESLTQSQQMRQALIDAPTMNAFPPLEGAGPDDPMDLPHLEDPSSEVPISQASSSDSVIGEENNAMLDEMDFSSLLEDSLSGHKSLFGQDSNPFLDVGITSDSISEPLGAIPEEPQDASGLFESDDDTNTFFIDAPSVANESEDESLDISGTFELDLAGADQPGMAAGGGGAPAQQRSELLAPGPIAERPTQRRTTTAPRSTNKGAIAALGLLALVIGVGVGAEALGFGWFFMDVLFPAEQAEQQQTQVAASPEGGDGVDPGGATSAPAPKLHKPVGDTPAAYDIKIAEVKQKLQQDTSNAELNEKLLLLQLRYRYRWPGRFHRDEARKAELGALLGAAPELGIQAQFWDLMGKPPGKDENREALLTKAEVVISQLQARRLPPKRDLLYKALLFRDQKKLGNALGLLNLVVKDVPDDQWALFVTAALLLKQENLDGTDTMLDNLLRLAPNHIDGVMLASRALVARQTPDAYARARKMAERALAIAQESQDAYGEYEANLMRAVIYGLQNDLGRRLEALEGAAKYDPRDETLLLELAENDLKSGEAEKAAERLKSCEGGVCSSIRYYRTHIKILYVSHKLAEAENLIVKAEAAHPGIPDLLFWAGKVLEARGKLTLAARKFTLVKEKDPKYLEAYLRLAGIHRREKEFERAIGVLDEASKVFEGAGKDSNAAMALLQERGELLVKQGRLEQAREVFGKIVAAQPTNAPARVRLAKLLTELGYPQKAIPHFEKLYEQGKSDPEVNIWFAEALIRSGKPDRAIEELRTFLEHNPKSLEGLVKLGHAYVQKQRYEEAMAVLEHAAAINQNYAPAFFFGGLAELGRQRQKAEEVERKKRNGEVIREDEKADFTKAIIALTTAKDRAPDNLEYRQALAEALTESRRERNLLAALEQYDTILAAYRKRMRLGRPVKRQAIIYYNRGLLASKLGRPRPEILKNFQEALVLDGERGDFVARYAEELYRLQSKRKVGDRYVLEAKAYFEMVLKQHNPDHVRANYYMGKITLKEWDQLRGHKPGDSMHKQAYDYFVRAHKYGGEAEFPDVSYQIGNMLRDRGQRRLSNEYYKMYLKAYRRLHKRDPKNAPYIRDLIRKR